MPSTQSCYYTTDKTPRYLLMVQTSSRRIHTDIAVIRGKARLSSVMMNSAANLSR
ncbi:hypothetical protein O9929_12890 [Vibrio lentus]|nr:hypothetical protein [Vibrio lentus]